MPGRHIKVGQVWVRRRGAIIREYHVITAIGSARTFWGTCRYAYASIFAGGKIIRENTTFTELNENDTSTNSLDSWDCITNNGLAGLEKALKREVKKLKNPPIYRRTKRKEYRDRLIAAALTGTKPIA